MTMTNARHHYTCPHCASRKVTSLEVQHQGEDGYVHTLVCGRCRESATFRSSVTPSMAFSAMGADWCHRLFMAPWLARPRRPWLVRLSSYFMAATHREEAWKESA